MVVSHSFGGTREAKRNAAVDMKLEVVVVPVSDVDRAKTFYRSIGFDEDVDYACGEATASSSSRPPVRRLRSSSARASPKPYPAPSRACTWSSATSRQPGPNSWNETSRSVRSSTMWTGSSTECHPPARCSGPTRLGATTHRSRGFRTRTATAGSCRRARRSQEADDRSRPRCDGMARGLVAGRVD